MVIIVLWEYCVKKSGPVVMIWDGMIRNELTGLFRVREQLKVFADMYCSFPKKSIEPYPGNLLLAQLKKIIANYSGHVSKILYSGRFHKSGNLTIFNTAAKERNNIVIIIISFCCL